MQSTSGKPRGRPPRNAGAGNVVNIQKPFISALKPKEMPKPVDTKGKKTPKQGRGKTAVVEPLSDDEVLLVEPRQKSTRKAKEKTAQKQRSFAPTMRKRQYYYCSTCVDLSVLLV